MKTFKSTFNLNTFLVIFLILVSTLSSANNSKIPLQSEVYGLLTHVYSGNLLENVQIKATDGVNEFLTQTNAEGAYSMIVTPGVYDFTFKLAGYYTDTIFNFEISPDTQTELNDSLRRFPYPPTNVHGEVIDNGQVGFVSWSLPDGSYEIGYDDADAEDYSVWDVQGGFYTVKFSPTNFPVTVTGGRLYVGDGTFPEGNNFLGTTVSLHLFDDDGINNLPGTVIESVVLTVDNYYWLKFDSVFNHVFEDGSFYLAMEQINNLPNVAPIGIDNDNSISNRSYEKAPESTNWILSANQNYMIRANVVGEIIENKSGKQSNDFIIYDVFRSWGFNHLKGEGPENGIVTGIGSSSALIKNDTQFGGLLGFYGYCVNASYEESGHSQLAFSNIVISGMDRTVSITAELCCDDSCDDIEVNLSGHNYPYQSLSDLTNTECNTVFEEVIYGYYDIQFHKDGYQDIILDSVFIYSDTSFAVIMEENLIPPPPTNLNVDPLSLKISWEKPATKKQSSITSNLNTYKIYLNSVIIAELPNTVFEYTFENLIFGQEYTAKVRAQYDSTLSSAATTIFTSKFLFPANSLYDNYLYGTDSVPLFFKVPTNEELEIPNGLISFNMYSVNSLIGNTIYSGESITDTISFTHYNLSPGDYIYQIGAVYNLETYGFPNETAESMLISTDSISVEIIGINDLFESRLVNIFPNPATNVVTISSHREISKIEVFNQMGQKVATFENVNSRYYKLDVSQLKKGTYILNLKTDEMSVSRKLIIGIK